MDPQIIERAIMRCIDISVRLGALEDEVPPAAGRVIVQCVEEIDEMQRWLDRPRVNSPAVGPEAASPAEPHPSPRRGHKHAGGGSRRSERSTTTAPSAAP